MKSVSIINNLEEHKKHLNINKIPSKYYEPKNNVNIRNYLKEDVIKFQCEKDSYLSLNQLVQLIDSIKNGNTNEFQRNNDNSIWKQSHSSYMNDKLIPKKNNFHNDTFDDNSVILIENTNKNNLFTHGNEMIQNHNSGNNEKQVEKSNFFKSNSLNIPKRNYEETEKASTCLQNFHVYEYTIEKNSDTKRINNAYQKCNSLPHKERMNTNHVNTHTHPSDTTNNKNNRNDTNTKQVNVNAILNALLTRRMELLEKTNMRDPEQLISMKNLKMILLCRPKNLDDIRKLHLVGFEEDKIKKYGSQFINVLKKFQ